MKWLIVPFVLLSITASAKLTVTGTYQGRNLYVQNPMDDEGFGYCTDSIRVNDYLLTTGFAIGAYEIQLDTMGLATGDSVSIIIYHQDGCKPKILQTNHYPARQNVFLEVQMKAGALHWKCEESTVGVFTVEIYRWNKWVTLEEIQSNKTQMYSVPVKEQGHSGTNEVRVKFKDGLNNIKNSKSISFGNDQELVEVEYIKKEKLISFSAETNFELFDSIGNMVKRGRGSNVDCMSLNKGVYYLNFDNSNMKVVVRK